jgi:hypothetical protein
MRSALKPWTKVSAVITALTLFPLVAMGQDQPPQAPSADENTDNRRPGNNRDRGEFRGGRGRGEERREQPAQQVQTQAPPTQLVPNADGSAPQNTQRSREGRRDGERRWDGNGRRDGEGRRDGGRRDRGIEQTTQTPPATDNTQSRDNMRRHQNFMNGDGNGLANGRRTDSEQSRDNVRRQQNLMNGTERRADTDGNRDRNRGDRDRDGNRSDRDGRRNDGDRDNNRRVDNDRDGNWRDGNWRDRNDRDGRNWDRDDRRDNNRGDRSRGDRHRWNRDDWNRYYANNRSWDWDRRVWNSRHRHGRSRYDHFRYRDPGYRWRGASPRIIFSLNYTFPAAYYDIRETWRGPLYDEELWLTFEPSVYDALPETARQRHEQTFLFALYGPLGATETWTHGSVRGDITMLDEHYFGDEWCRDFVQSIRTPTWKRTTDGRMCIGWGEPWRFVSEY